MALGIALCSTPAVGWERPPANTPDPVRIDEAAELKRRYLELFEQGEYGEAAAVAEQACTILEREHGDQSTPFADCLGDRGTFLRKRGANDIAQPLSERALALHEKTLGPQHPTVAIDLSNLGALYQAQGKYGRARSSFERALAIRESKFGPRHPSVAKVLVSLALVDKQQGDYGRAEKQYLEAIAIYEEEQDVGGEGYSVSLVNLANLYREQGEFASAQALYERALVIVERVSGPEHPDTATVINNLAGLYGDRAEYREAMALYERSLAIREKTLGPVHPEVAHSLNNMAMVLRRQGDYRRSGELQTRALAISEKTLGPEHPAVARIVGNLASLRTDQGAYGAAEPLYERALATLEKALGPEHPAVGMTLNNLALLYRYHGAYEKAEPLYARAMVIFENVLGPRHSFMASIHHNMALLMHDKGEYERARAASKLAMDIQQEVLGTEHPDFALSLNNFANMYRDQGRYDLAEPMHLRAQAIYEKALGAEHPDYAMSLNNLGLAYSDQREYDKAEFYMERALAIREKVLEPSHFLIGLNLRNLARMYHDKGEHDRALKLHRRALEMEEDNLVRTLTVVDEARKLAYASTLSSSLRYTLSLHLRANPENHELARLALTTLLRRKARVLDLVTQSNAALRRSLPDGDRHLLDDLADVDSRLAALSQRGPDRDDLDSHAERIDELRRKRDRLWGELATRSADVQALQHSITIEDIQAALCSDCVLIEFAKFVPVHRDDGERVRRYDTRPLPRYAAYLISPGHVDWIDLGPAPSIEAEIEGFRAALQTKTKIPTGLHGLVIRPVVERVGPARRLILAPAGRLSIVPFAAIHDGARYLVQQYELRYVTSGRDLLEGSTPAAVATTPVAVVANPAGALLTEAESEAEFLEAFFPDAHVLRGVEATETGVRAIERPVVLHLATHGFFGEAGERRGNPMFRSGLQLADIDESTTDPERDDGKLTAYEVSGMDLRGTQLVVLSGCETGMGEVDMGEGVFGLRRAFATAGAKTTMMSLWDVSGVTARVVMESYYGKLAKGLGPGEAMQAVQLEMLQTTAFAHPKDWAAFIVSGSDDPLGFSRGQDSRAGDSPAPSNGPPPISRRTGCTVSAGRPEGSPSVGMLLIGLLAIASVRRSTSSSGSCLRR